MVTVPTLLHGGITATSDLPFKLVNTDTWVETVDIFVLDNSAFFGDIGIQDIPVIANDIYYSLVPINLNDIFIRNVTAGANTRITFYAVLMTDARKKQLGIPLG